MSGIQSNIQPYSKIIIKLLKGTINSSDSVWDEMIFHKNTIQKYVNVIGLEFIIKDLDGYAYLRQFQIDEDDNSLGLVSRKQVGFETSVLLVILRQLIEDFENDPTDFRGSEKYIDKEELIEQIELFLPEEYDTIGYLKKLDHYITRVEDLGYIKELSDDDTTIRYKIHRIIKERVNIDTLESFKKKLEEYVKSI